MRYWALNFVWRQWHIPLCELIFKCFCVLNECIKWLSVEEDVLNVMPHMSCWGELVVVKILPRKIVANGRVVEVPHGQELKMCLFNGEGKMQFTACCNRYWPEYISQNYNYKVFTSRYLDRVSNFTKIGCESFNVWEHALIYPQSPHTIWLEVMTDEGTQALEHIEHYTQIIRNFLEEQDSFPSKSEKWLFRARRNDWFEFPLWIVGWDGVRVPFYWSDLLGLKLPLGTRKWALRLSYQFYRIGPRRGSER